MTPDRSGRWPFRSVAATPGSRRRIRQRCARGASGALRCLGPGDEADRGLASPRTGGSSASHAADGGRCAHHQRHRSPSRERPPNRDFSGGQYRIAVLVAAGTRVAKSWPAAWRRAPPPGALRPGCSSSARRSASPAILSAQLVAGGGCAFRAPERTDVSARIAASCRSRILGGLLAMPLSVCAGGRLRAERVGLADPLRSLVQSRHGGPTRSGKRSLRHPSKAASSAFRPGNRWA